MAGVETKSKQEAATATAGSAATMEQTTAAAAAPNVEAETAPLNHPDEAARFRIFVIDTGWQSVASKVLHENFGLIRDLNPADHAFIVDRATSIALLRQHNSLVGRDPIICVHDLHAIQKGAIRKDGPDDGVHGFRLHLGLLRTEKSVLSALQMFARFLRTHRASRDMEGVIRQKLRLEGFAGAIQIIGGKVPQVELFEL